MVAERCQESGAWSWRGKSGKAFARQREDDFHAACRYWVLRRRDQRRQGPCVRKKRRAKKFHELFWLRRRAQIGKRARTSCAASRITDRASSARYDSAQPARPLGLSKAQGLSRRIASAQRAAATIGQARLTNFYGSSTGIHRHWSSKNFRRAHSHDSGDRQDPHQRPQFRALLPQPAPAARGSSAIASRKDGP